MDTGHESTVEARCGMMDGEITSTVDGTEQPTKDNESNFGTGYGYQYGTHEGLIEIYMNDKWWVFATEKECDCRLSDAASDGDFGNGGPILSREF